MFSSRIFFDASPGTVCASCEAMVKSDAVVLVTEPTPFCLHDMRLAFQLVRTHQKPCAIIINKNSPGYTGIEAFSEKEGVPIIARIPYSPSLAEAYSEGKVPKSSDSALAIALSQIESWLSDVFKGGRL